VDACQTIADELYPLAERNKFPWPLTYARFLRGWLTAQQGDPEAGIEQMLKTAEEPSAAVLHPIALALIAEQQTRIGRLGAAIGTLDRALKEVREQPARFYEAEIIRLRGESLLLQSPGNAAEAEQALREAMAVATRQSCRTLALRAGVSLAKLLGQSGRQVEARDLLAPIYGAFTEGFDWPDLKAAKVLIDQGG
jgi:predicted ATPase